MKIYNRNKMSITEMENPIREIYRKYFPNPRELVGPSDLNASWADFGLAIAQIFLKPEEDLLAENHRIKDDVQTILLELDEPTRERIRKKLSREIVKRHNI